MESYNFVLDNLKITNTRASHLDTDYANWGVAVNDVMVPGSPQTKSISDQRYSYICRVRHRSSGPRMVCHSHAGDLLRSETYILLGFRKKAFDDIRN